MGSENEQTWKRSFYSLRIDTVDIGCDGNTNTVVRERSDREMILRDERYLAIFASLKIQFPGRFRESSKGFFLLARKNYGVIDTCKEKL